MNTIFIFLIVKICVCSASFSILDYGAIPNNASNSAAEANSIALYKVLIAANSSLSDRVAQIPANFSFALFETVISKLYNVTLLIEGTLAISNNITAWPKTAPTGDTFLSSLYISDSEYITIDGANTGQFDGQGYDWWWYVFITTIDNRPVMFCMERCKNVLIRRMLFKNSPMYHVYATDMLNMEVVDTTVHVNVEKQQEILRHFGYFDENLGIPVFPLNTDGIDFAGRNFYMHNCTILNYDDAVAIKPSNNASHIPGGGNCTTNVLVENCHIELSVGMSIGSVPSNPNCNCIRNVTFNSILMSHPIKALYIKTNPPDDPNNPGTGIIDQITYQNFTVDGALWYPIWIGPQQQRQPGTPGNGCSFFYPIIDTCPTNSLVPISNIVLRNISLKRGVTLPGVLLCNETNPCTGFVFDNVMNEGEFVVQKDYVCQNVFGNVTNSTPQPPCF